MLPFLNPIINKSIHWTKNTVMPFLRRHGLEAILVIISLFLLGFTVVKTDTLNQEREKTKALTHLIEGKNHVIETYKNKNGELVQTVDALKLSKNTLKEMHKQKEFEWLHKFESLKKNYRNLENAYQISLNASSKIENISYQDTVINITVDTVERVRSMIYKDKYTYLKALLDEKGKSHFEYDIKIPLEVVCIWQRKWFLGKKKWIVEAVSSNKNVKVGKLNTIIIKKK
ncbi:DUF6549 family protein [Flammeovirga sp. SJP92]|uniref:DUF6549 family protein n=1 Tax=Flammeovirga sp. SJP92 TaxID=1775430 RepID=UPI000788F12C|nr:DUF6549 family protein [Flammeovirga sp. SJP92]KXX72764.1 hypothetical protein AVL50_32200 [Flammeovirga sp. SJP92]